MAFIAAMKKLVLGFCFFFFDNPLAGPLTEDDTENQLKM